MERRRSRGPRAGGRCGRDDSSSGGVAGWIFPHRRRSVRVRRNRGGCCVVLLVTLRITCACGRGPARHVCAAAGPGVAGRGSPARAPLWRPRVAGRSRLAARAWLARGRVPCSAWPRPDAARGPGVVSADSCGAGAAGGPASGGSDSRGGSFSSPWDPPRAAPRIRRMAAFRRFYYLPAACMLWFSWCTKLLGVLRTRRMTAFHGLLCDRTTSSTLVHRCLTRIIDIFNIITFYIFK